jgi:hypothetical protein
MAVTHSVRRSAAVKRNTPTRERQELLASRRRERQELSEFLDAFEFDDAPGEDDARCLIAVVKF